MKLIKLLVTLTILLSSHVGSVLAQGFITVEPKEEAQWPQVFVVDKKGESQLVDSREGRVIPNSAKVEIRDAQPQDVIHIVGEVRVEVLGGAGELHLLGDPKLGNPQLVVSADVGETKIKTLAGSPTVTVGEGEAVSLPPGKVMKVTTIENQLKVEIISESPQATPQAPSQEPVTSVLPSTETVQTKAPSGTGEQTIFKLSPEEQELLDFLTRAISKASPEPDKNLFPSPTFSQPEESKESLEGPLDTPPVQTKVWTSKEESKVEDFLRKRDELEEISKKPEKKKEASPSE